MLPLSTPRLSFRTWREDDDALAWELWGDPEVTRFIARAPLSRDEVRGRLEAELARGREQGLQYWPTFLRDGGALVGCCGLRPYDPGARVLELGFHLRPAFWGRGLATEAARAAIALAFTEANAAALVAGRHPENAASRRTLEKLGFRFTGVERYAATGRDHSSYRLERPKC